MFALQIQGVPGESETGQCSYNLEFQNISSRIAPCNIAEGSFHAKASKPIARVANSKPTDNRPDKLDQTMSRRAGF